MVPHAFAQSPSAGNSDEVAFAMPRLHSPNSGDVAFPQPLAPSDVARIRRIFALQEQGDIPRAVSETGRLDDTTVLGAILADRYLRRPAEATLDDLSGWLTKYADQADAPAVRGLAMTRLPEGATLPPLASAFGPLDPLDPEEAEPSGIRLQRNPTFDAGVLERARNGQIAAALRLIERTRGLSRRYANELRAQVARILLTGNRDAEALSTALASMSEPAADNGVAGTVGGLAAWRLDRVAVARSMFEAAARAQLASPTVRAGAAFWAARTYLRGHDTDGALPWMRRAAAEPRTFYGLLARRALGMGIGLPSGPDMLSTADVDAIGATSQGLRAFALLQVGQTGRAEAELRTLWPTARQNVTLGRSLLLVARKAGFTDLATELGALMQSLDGRPHDEERFAVPKLKPRGGFQLDPSLVYALTRLESNFDPSAISSAGARGLMQIMPVTAGYLTGDAGLADESQERLHDPALNLQIGQRYVLYLSRHEAVNGSLIHLLASYNAGPGNVRKWSESMNDGGDPLMFIESIPFDETRAFVQRVLAYSWIYAARLGLASPSIDELAGGAWPRFRSSVARQAVPVTVH